MLKHARLYVLCTAFFLAGGSVFSTPEKQEESASRLVALKILAHCQSCHSGAKPQGGLDLTSRELILKGGASGASIVPGNSDISRLYKRIAARQMPPGSPLSAEEIKTIQKWIDSGAKWDIALPTRADQNWWSLKPFSNPIPPRARNAKWVKNPIDAFVMSRLEKEGLHPAPMADRGTLLRRVYFDLIGLPPTPLEMDRYLNDTSKNAYEKLIDRLLADPRYGEHWARHWLDVARFGESHGFERDQLRPNAWRYRDYVIQSINEDKPYGEFIKEQIAGDVLEPNTATGVIATGFLVGAPYDEVGYTQVSSVMKARVHEEAMEELVGTVAQTFLGLTVNCARCHDHKFDPITQIDFYRMRSALSGVRHGDRSIYSAETEKIHSARTAKIRKDSENVGEEISFIKNVGRKRVLEKSNSLISVNRNLPKPVACWTFEDGIQESIGGLHSELHGGAKVSNGRLILGAGEGYLQSETLPVTLYAKTLEAWVILPDRSQKGGGVFSVQSGQQFDSIVYSEREQGKWIAGSEGFHRTQELSAPPESSARQNIIHLAASYSPNGTIALYRNGKPYGSPYKPANSPAEPALFEAKKSFALIGLRHIGASNGFLHAEIEEARLYDRELSAAELEASYAAGTQTVPIKSLIAALLPDERKKLQGLENQRNELNRSLEKSELPSLTYAANSVVPEPTHVLLRGDPESPTILVAPGGLSSIKYPSGDWKLSADAPEGIRRKYLAEWISSPRNPLPWRVMANRIWLHHFGKGIVETPSDFGFNGDRPSHPELLDWLASAYLHNGGRMKPLHKAILLSNTYCQSNQYTPAFAAKDADNRLLWRFAPRRLEGEEVRDELLSVSGSLNPKVGGPSFRPFTEFVDNSHFYKLIDSNSPDFNRRSIYRMSVHSAKSPLLETFDCPDPSTKTPRRTTTTTPLQALELMNSSFVLRQSKLLSQRLNKEAGTAPSAQLQLLYRLTYGRSPNKKEISEGLKFLHEYALNTFCWSVVNSSEFLYVR